jgi:AcrR family transcriptional regulator
MFMSRREIRNHMPRYKRQDWLEQGLHILSHDGVDALTIDALCQALRVTKGSFYHHFEHREAFLEAVLQHWEDHYTSQFITQSMEAKTPEGRLHRLLQLVVASHGTNENSIRAWAQNSPVARVFQERVDQRRVAFVYECLLAYRADQAWAHTTAQMLYIIMLGASAIMPPLSQEALAQIYQLLEVHFVSSSSITADEE